MEFCVFRVETGGQSPRGRPVRSPGGCSGSAFYPNVPPLASFVHQLRQPAVVYLQSEIHVFLSPALCRTR